MFVRDLQLGTTTLVSVNRFGTGSGNSGSSIWLRDQRGQPFRGIRQRSERFGGERYQRCYLDVFVRDLQLGTTTLVSVNRFGTGSGNGFSFSPEISADGRFVAFSSAASDLVANDTNGTGDVFVRDLQLGTTTLVSVNRFGTGSGNSSSVSPVISPDGRFVAFQSGRAIWWPTIPTGTGDVFVRDLQLGTTTLVSVNRFGTGPAIAPRVPHWPEISADGRFVAFSSAASDLVANDTNGTDDVFVRDLQLGTTTLVSINRFGTGSGNGFSGGLRDQRGRPFRGVSERCERFGGQRYQRYASDVFVRDLQLGTTALVSINRSGTGSGNSSSAVVFVISADGRFVAFESRASDLVANDTNGTTDVFVRPVAP